MNQQVEIATLLSSRELLQDKLQRNFAGKDVNSGVNVSIVNNGNTLTLQHGVKAGNISENTKIPVSCIAKSMTATLMAIAIEEYGISLETPVSDLLPGNQDLNNNQGTPVRLHHLLSHTHGQDDWHIRNVPRGRNGRIDMKALLDKITRYKPLYLPGERFNYSNPPYWLIASILERLYGIEFTSLLQERLLEPLNIQLDLPEGANQAVCPALGHNLSLSSQDLCRILSLYMPGCGAPELQIENLENLLMYSSRLPGWSPKEKSVHCGWRGYGKGWYGHNGRYGGYMVMIRFNPSANIALAVTGTDQRSSDTAYRALFSDILPEFSDHDIMPPPMLSAAQWEQSDSQQFHGVYQNSQFQLHLDCTDSKHLRLRAFDRTHGSDPDAPAIKRFLRPAENNVFFAVPSDPLHFPFVQFIEPTPSNGFEYLWNGSSLWKRIDT